MEPDGEVLSNRKFDILNKRVIIFQFQYCFKHCENKYTKAKPREYTYKQNQNVKQIQTNNNKK